MFLWPSCKTDHYLICNPGIPRRENLQLLTVKMSKERSWEEFGRRLDSNYSSANKVFWQTIRRLHGKFLNTTTFIKNSTGNILRVATEIQNIKRLENSAIIPIYIYKKGDRKECMNYRGISLRSLPGKVYAKCLERKCREMWNQSWKMSGFCPDRTTTDQIFTLETNLLEILGEC